MSMSSVASKMMSSGGVTRRWDGKRGDRTSETTSLLSWIALVVAALAVGGRQAGAFPSLGGSGAFGGQQMELGAGKQMGPDCPEEVKPPQPELGGQMHWPPVKGAPRPIDQQVVLGPMAKGPLQMMLMDVEHCEDNSSEEQQPQYSPYMMKFMDDDQHQQMEEEHHRIEPHVDYLEKEDEGPKYEIIDQQDEDSDEHQQKHQHYQHRQQQYPRPAPPAQLKMSDFDLPGHHQFHQRHRGTTSSYTGHFDYPAGQRKGQQQQQQGCEHPGKQKSPPAPSKISYRPLPHTSPRPPVKTIVKTTTTEAPHQQQEQVIYEPQRSTEAPTKSFEPQQATEAPTEAPTKAYEPQQTSEAPPSQSFEPQRTTEAPPTKTVDEPQQQTTETPPAKGQEREPELATTTEAPIKTVVVVDEPQATEAPPAKGQEPEPATTTSTTAAPGKTVPVLQTNRDEPQEPFGVKFDDDARLRARIKGFREQQQVQQQGQQLAADEAGRVSDASFGETNIHSAANQRARDSFLSAAEQARSLASRHSSQSQSHGSHSSGRSSSPSNSQSNSQTLANGGTLTGWASVRTASIARDQPELASGASSIEAVYLGLGQLERHETNGRVQARLSCQLGEPPAESRNSSVWNVEWARFEGAYDPEEPSFECRSATADCRALPVKTDTLVTVHPRPTAAATSEQPESYSLTIHQVEEQHLGTYRCSAMRRPVAGGPQQLVYRIVPLQSIN